MSAGRCCSSITIQAWDPPATMCKVLAQKITSVGSMKNQCLDKMDNNYEEFTTPQNTLLSDISELTINVNRVIEL